MEGRTAEGEMPLIRTDNETVDQNLKAPGKEIGFDEFIIPENSEMPMEHENKVQGNGPQIILPDYPKHGIIGSREPMSINMFYIPKCSEDTTTKNFKRSKFDFHKMYEQNLSKNGIIQRATPLPGLGYLCRGFRTEDFYQVDPRLPLRFRNPDLLQGYGCERQEHPLFRTTSSEYGKFGPTVHDVPLEYHGLKNTFTIQLSSTGMPKNRSLNIK